MVTPRHRRFPAHRVQLLPLLALLLAPTPSLHAGKQTFDYTGAQQNFVVPTGATTVTVQAFGAQGGMRPNRPAANLDPLPISTGGTTTATIPATTGETLAIFVGGAGADGTNTPGGVPGVPNTYLAGGFNGGGAASTDTPYSGGSGGGASDVRQGGTALANRVVVAGGGGGQGGSPTGLTPGGGGFGGGLLGYAGGAPEGTMPYPYADGDYGAYKPGGGGTQTAGGKSGYDTTWGNNPVYATDGALGVGGTGDGASTGYEAGGGGGGGGYYGGGGGGSPFGTNNPASSPGGGGGGGSSYAISTATNVTLQPGQNRFLTPNGGHIGNGQVILSFSGATIYWSGTGSGAVAGGSGTWNTTNARWSTTSNGSTYAVWDNALPDEAVFQNTAGTVTVGTGVTVNSLSFGVSGYTLAGSNAITLAGSGTVATGAFNATIDAPIAGTAGLAKSGSGTLTLSGASTFSGGTAINEGAIKINNSTGSVFGAGGVTVASSATLTGSGSFTGALTLAAGATLSPGNSPGLMTIGSGSILSGTTLMEIAGLSRGTSYDAINVDGAGAITFGGTLQATFLSGFSPVAGNSFNLFDYTTGTGAFGLLDLPALSSGLAWDTSALYTTGVLSVSAVPEPSTYAVVFGVLALGLAVAPRRRPRDCQLKMRPAPQRAREDRATETRPPT